MSASNILCFDTILGMGIGRFSNIFDALRITIHSRDCIFCNKNDKFPEKLQSDEAGLIVGVLEAGLAAGDDVELVIR